jgi:hypothetical protein
MLGTKRCDRCYELESRIHGDMDLALKILVVALDRDGEAPEWHVGFGRAGSTDPVDHEGDARAVTAIGPKVEGFDTVRSVISPDHNHWDGPCLDIDDEAQTRILMSVNLLRNLPVDKLLGAALWVSLSRKPMQEAHLDERK